MPPLTRSTRSNAIRPTRGKSDRTTLAISSNSAMRRARRCVFFEDRLLELQADRRAKKRGEIYSKQYWVQSILDTFCWDLEASNGESHGERLKNRIVEVSRREEISGCRYSSYATQKAKSMIER